MGQMQFPETIKRHSLRDTMMDAQESTEDHVMVGDLQGGDPARRSARDEDTKKKAKKKEKAEEEALLSMVFAPETSQELPVRARDTNGWKTRDVSEQEAVDGDSPASELQVRTFSRYVVRSLTCVIRTMRRRNLPRCLDWRPSWCASYAGYQTAFTFDLLPSQRLSTTCLPTFWRPNRVTSTSSRSGNGSIVIFDSLISSLPRQIPTFSGVARQCYADSTARDCSSIFSVWQLGSKRKLVQVYSDWGLMLPISRKLSTQASFTMSMRNACSLSANQNVGFRPIAIGSRGFSH